VIRSYLDADYGKLKEMYQHREWYGGVFDEARDGRERLAQKIADDPEAILVYEENGELVGTISIIEDGRVAMLLRFVVKDNDAKISEELYEKTVKILKSRGHSQLLVYSEAGNSELDNRYISLGLTKGNNYTCFWTNL